MKKITCILLASVVVTVSAFAGFYFISRPLLRYFGVSEYANGAALVPFLMICIGCVVIGAIAGLFLFPVALRPFLSSSEFWLWIRAERKVTVPLLDPVLERWAVQLYGPRSHAKKFS
jgi:hypothetical protein